MSRTSIHRRVLVAGASGSAGRHIVRLLLDRGVTVRTLSRRAGGIEGVEHAQADLTDPASFGAACVDVDAIISTAGASLDVRALRDRKSFTAVDRIGNGNLLDAAARTGVRKFVYVSLAGADRLQHTEYARAHEQFARELARSGISYAIVRPTGFFSVQAEILSMARQGRAMLVGDGSARTNPVHEADVAEACVDALFGTDPAVGVGGPETFTRRQIVELAFDVLGRPPVIRTIPPALSTTMSAALRLVHRRIGGLVHFGSEVSRIDVIAEPRGVRRLREYFEELTT